MCTDQLRARTQLQCTNDEDITGSPSQVLIGSDTMSLDLHAGYYHSDEKVAQQNVCLPAIRIHIAALVDLCSYSGITSTSLCNGAWGQRLCLPSGRPRETGPAMRATTTQGL